jgi:hypothetical protein
MATLKEAVESGRRWRHPEYSRGRWEQPGSWQPQGVPARPDFSKYETEVLMPTRIAISDDFEIEPEPSRCDSRMFGLRCDGREGHAGDHSGSSGGTSAEWAKRPEPKKPREYVLHWGYWHQDRCMEMCPTDRVTRVHDAEACERLKGKP